MLNDIETTVPQPEQIVHYIGEASAEHIEPLLSKPLLRWLSPLVHEGDIGWIADQSDDIKAELADRIGDRYCLLKNNQTKRQMISDAVILVDLFVGRSYAEIAEQEGLTAASANRRIKKIGQRLVSEVTKDDISAMIQDVCEQNGIASAKVIAIRPPQPEVSLVEPLSEDTTEETTPSSEPNKFDDVDDTSHSEASAPEATEEAYFNRILAHRLMTGPEELALARRIERGDLVAKEELLVNNTKLIMSIARQYQGHGLSISDLFQEGADGMIRASEKFDHRQGFRFSTYATLWVRQSIQRAIQNKARSIRYPANVDEKARKVEKARIKYTAINEGAAPTYTELAELTEIPVEKIQDMEQLPTVRTSLDSPIGEDDGSFTLGDMVADSTPNVYEQMVHDQTVALVHNALSRLPKLDEDLLRMAYGLTEDGTKYTLTQIAKRHGVTRQAIAQRIKHSQRVLKMNAPELEDLLD